MNHRTIQEVLSNITSTHMPNILTVNWWQTLIIIEKKAHKIFIIRILNIKKESNTMIQLIIGKYITVAGMVLSKKKTQRRLASNPVSSRNCYTLWIWS
jgi:hypothetical protein